MLRKREDEAQGGKARSCCTSIPAVEPTAHPCREPALPFPWEKLHNPSELSWGCLEWGMGEQPRWNRNAGAASNALRE